MRRILFALAILALAVPAVAHDVNVVHAVEVLKAQVADLRARQDILQSQIHNQGAAIDQLYELVDHLKARLDMHESRALNQAGAIDELFRLVDQALAGPDVPDKEP